MTRYLPALLALSAAGCDRVWQLDPLDRPADAMTDAEQDGPPDIGIDARTCFGSAANLFSTCLTAPLDPPRFLSGTIDTANDQACRAVIQSSGEPVCVIAAASIEVSSSIIVRGSRPLVLIAGDFIQIDATIDASSTAGRSGPGAQTLGDCDTDGNGSDSTTGGGGASGGTFGFRGGAGQHGGGVFTTAHAASVPVTLADVRGGCAGYTGGLSTNAGGTKAKGGFGGGAVYLIAGSYITVSTTGRVNASGAGGSGGPIAGGGGGGGAGGLIAFDAPTVTIEGQVFARGGGGGSGGSSTAPGNRGAEPIDVTATTPGGAIADGGSSAGFVGCGGPDGTQGGNTNGTSATAGGSAGGGGCGYIFVYAETRNISAATSPAILP